MVQIDNYIYFPHIFFAILIYFIIFAHETLRTLLILNILVEKIYVKYGREVVHVVYLIAWTEKIIYFFSLDCHML